MGKRKRRTRQSDRPAQRARADRAARQPRWIVVLTVAGLCTVHYVLAVTSVLHKSNTYDELAHLTRGYSYRMTDDYRLGPPHPPLAHYWASLPGPMAKVKFPPLDQDAWHTSNVWVIGQQFFYYRNLGNAAIIDSLLFRGRAMIALWSVALGLIVFSWSRRLFGMAGGIVSLVVFAFSPTMLAHGRLVTTDCAVALFFMCSLATVWWLLHRVSPASVLLGAASLACLFLAKMSAVLIIPVGLVLLVIRLIVGQPLEITFGKWHRTLISRWAQAGCFVTVIVLWIAVTWIAIWAAYGFRYAAMRDAEPGRDRFHTAGRLPEGKDIWEYELRTLDQLAPVITWLREHRVFPEAYIYCAVSSAQTARGRNAFLNGEVNIKGFRSFFPYVFLVKTPLPLFGLLGVAATVPWFKAHKRTAAEGEGRVNLAFLYALAPLVVFLVAYWIVSIRSHLNIGHRHIMPTYPILFILCGATACYLEFPRRVLRWLVPGLLGLLVLASLWCYPHYLTYFNVLAGGPDRAYDHLVDSSLDWGQDLPGLKRYLDERRAAGDSGDVNLSYFGSGGALAVSHYDIDARLLPERLSDDATGEFRLGPGLYAVSVTNLQQVYAAAEEHQWTPALEAEYRRRLPAFEEFAATPNTPEARAPWATRPFRQDFRRFIALRFARLCAYLRAHEPDLLINHTIYVKQLRADDITTALYGEVPTDDGGD